MMDDRGIYFWKSKRECQPLQFPDLFYVVCVSFPNLCPYQHMKSQKRREGTTLLQCVVVCQLVL